MFVKLAQSERLIIVVVYCLTRTLTQPVVTAASVSTHCGWLSMCSSMTPLPMVQHMAGTVDTVPLGLSAHANCSNAFSHALIAKDPLQWASQRCACSCVVWRQMWWWEEAGLSQAGAMLSAVPLLRWRAWVAHCRVLHARRRAFVQVHTQYDAHSAHYVMMPCHSF